MPDFELEALRTLLTLATARARRELAEVEQDLLSFTEWWLAENATGNRLSTVEAANETG